MMKKLIPYMVFFTILLNISYSRKCFDYQLTDGAEPLLAYGMDSTLNWWAVTEPFDGFRRLIINGEELSTVRNLTTPVFAQDSYHWAVFMEDNSGWFVVDQDSSWRINTTNPGEITYSSDSEVMGYSYYEGDNLERIVIGHKSIQVFDRSSELILSQTGSKYAFVINRDGIINLNLNGKFSAVYDEITPIGFFHDDSFLWAASLGGNWHVYRDFEEISETYTYVGEGQLNPSGTTAVYSARLLSDQYVAVMLNDEFREPLETTRFDFITNLIVHPFEPIMVFEATFNNNFSIYMNTVSYEAGEQNTIPKFTHNGDDMFFVGCRIDCFASVNGRKYPLKTVGFSDMELAVKPNSETFAFATSTSLVVRDMNETELWSGMMCNETIPPRYNRFIDRYETLGVINNRLYLLTCVDER